MSDSTSSVKPSASEMMDIDIKTEKSKATVLYAFLFLLIGFSFFRCFPFPSPLIAIALMYSHESDQSDTVSLKRSRVDGDPDDLRPTKSIKLSEAKSTLPVSPKRMD